MKSDARWARYVTPHIPIGSLVIGRVEFSDPLDRFGPIFGYHVAERVVCFNFPPDDPRAGTLSLRASCRVSKTASDCLGTYMGMTAGKCVRFVSVSKNNDRSLLEAITVCMLEVNGKIRPLLEAEWGRAYTQVETAEYGLLEDNGLADPSFTDLPSDEDSHS